MPDYGVPLTEATASNPVRRLVSTDKDHFYGLTKCDYRESSTDSGTFRIEHDFNDNLTLSNSFRMVRATLDYVVTTPDDTKGNVDDGFETESSGVCSGSRCVPAAGEFKRENNNSGRLTREWQVFANYTYLDSEIVKGGVVAGVDGANDGNENPSTPENSFSFWSTYQLMPFLNVGAGANYVDSRYGNAADTVQVSNYWRYDAMANLKVSKNLDLQLNVQNLTDKRYFDQIYPTHMAHVAAGRTVLLATNFHF